jgi:GDP-D-mannose 3',5'-epimerase
VSAGAVDAVVAGGGGFIGGQLVRELLRHGLTVRSVDVKPFSEWYQVTSDAENLQLDLPVSRPLERLFGEHAGSTTSLWHQIRFEADNRRICLSLNLAERP